MGMKRTTGLAAVLVLALASGAAVACDAPDGAAGIRQGIVGWINESRRANGLPSLKVSDALQRSATAHACDMAAKGYFSHTGPGGSTFTRRLKKAGYKFSAANENIAQTQSASVDSPAGLWRNSSGHWANVLDPKVREVGVGVAVAGGKVYWVTNSGSR